MHLIKACFSTSMQLGKEGLVKYGKLSWKEIKEFMLWNKCQKHCKNILK